VLTALALHVTACGAQGRDEVESGLCEPGERAVFSCVLQNDKLVSLCGSSQEGVAPFVEYRYGKASHVELKYRATIGGAKKIFFFDDAKEKGEGRSNTTFIFRNGKYGYFLTALYSPALKAYDAPSLFVNLDGSDYLDTSNEFVCREDAKGKGIFSIDLTPLHPALTPIPFSTLKALQTRFRRANSNNIEP
jgi:hypothetical protein